MEFSSLAWKWINFHFFLLHVFHLPKWIKSSVTDLWTISLFTCFPVSFFFFFLRVCLFRSLLPVLIKLSLSWLSQTLPNLLLLMFHFYSFILLFFSLGLWMYMYFSTVFESWAFLFGTLGIRIFGSEWHKNYIWFHFHWFALSPASTVPHMIQTPKSFIFLFPYFICNIKNLFHAAYLIIHFAGLYRLFYSAFKGCSQGVKNLLKRVFIIFYSQV